MKLETSSTKFDLGYGEDIMCPNSEGSGQEHCQIDIVTLGDQKVKAEEKT
jgi:predicted deacylase